MARTENLLEQNLKDETLIYDLATNQAFNLNETATIIYKACGENLTIDELKRNHKFTDDLIYFALDELMRNNLISDESYNSPFSDINRREVVKKAGIALMCALPVITGLIAPAAAHAASVCPDPFTPGGIPNGCRTGGSISDVQSCEGQSDADRTSLCQGFGGIFIARCASGNAAYAGDCVTSGPNSSNYTCVCTA